jgi:dihydroorotate dehydrogenase (fumarate)
MIDLSTSYMGLSLPNPVIAGASRITGTLKGVVSCVEAGVGAVVLKSLFEEEITAQVGELLAESKGAFWHPEAADYISRYGQENGVEKYLELIRQAKAQIDVPLIASIHCVTAGQWTEFATRVEHAGADALELNIFVMPSDPRRDGRQNEQVYFDVLRAVKAKLSIPVALKVSTFFSSLSKTLLDLSRAGADALVLFNRYYAPDINVDDLTLKPANFVSTPDESVLPLRWIALMAPLVRCSLAATGGVHTGRGVVKQLLAGADAVQICSTLYKNGIDQIRTIVSELQSWMETHQHEKPADFRGKLSSGKSENPAAFERVQFMKTSVGIE